MGEFFMEKLKAKATLDNLNQFMTFVKEFTKKESIDLCISSDLELVAEEVIVNVVNYAYPEKANGEIELKLSRNNGIISFCIVDDGIPFDMTLAEDPDLTLSVDEKSIGGMGIFFVKKFMDDIRYKRRDNKNILILTKKCRLDKNSQEELCD